MTAPTRIECLAAASALDGAVHLVDDDESAEVLARTADQWREQAVRAADPAADLSRAYDALRILCGRVITVHGLVQMDTPEDKALHARAVAEFRRSLGCIDTVSPRPPLRDPATEATP